MVPSRAAQTAFAPELSKAITFFVFSPILVKFHIWTRLIESFPTIFRTWGRGEEKLHFTPVHTLRQLKRDEALIPPPRRVVEFRARYGKETARRFGGRPNRGTHGWGKIVLHTCSDLPRLVRTYMYVQYSDHVHSSRNVIFALSNALILQSYVLSWWNCMF